MTNDNDSLKHNPFASLKPLLKDKKSKSPGVKKTQPALPPPPAEEPDDETAFQDAMSDVTPMADDKYAPRSDAAKTLQPVQNREQDKNALLELENLVKYGEGFIVSNTPEYMEGTGTEIPPEFAERLHRGDFSIQAHIDLHGMGVAQAKDAFETFLNESLMRGRRAVLIIHGRGLSSPGEPVLKNKVSDWLTRSHWRKWVIAFTSAQSYDGGTGATYVLLRHSPATKKARKRNRPI